MQHVLCALYAKKQARNLLVFTRNCLNTNSNRARTRRSPHKIPGLPSFNVKLMISKWLLGKKCDDVPRENLKQVFNYCLRRLSYNLLFISEPWRPYLTGGDVAATTATDQSRRLGRLGRPKIACTLTKAETSPRLLPVYIFLDLQLDLSFDDVNTRSVTWSLNWVKQRQAVSRRSRCNVSSVSSRSRRRRGDVSSVSSRSRRRRGDVSSVAGKISLCN